MSHEEIISAVFDINDDIFDEDYPDANYLSFVTNGWSSRVDYGNIRLWDDEEDTRIYDEEADEFEPIETCLRRRLAEEIVSLSLIVSCLLPEVSQ